MGTMMMIRKWAIHTNFRVVVGATTRRRFSTSNSDLVVHGNSGHGTQQEALQEMEPRRRPAVALIFDTETTGPIHFKEHYTHPSQPDLVQLGILLVDTVTWQKKLQLSLLIRPTADTQDIQPGAQAVHGITKQDGERYGVPLSTALSILWDASAQADCLVAHNLKFDRAVIQTALFRSSAVLSQEPTSAWSADMAHICTMEYCTDLLRLPSRYSHTSTAATSYKWPTLSESYKFFTNGSEIEAAHDALTDATACLTIFRGLLERQVIPPILLRRDDNDLAPPPPPMVVTGPEAVEPPAMTPDAKLLLEEKKIVRSGDLILQMTPHNTLVVTGNTYRYKDVFKSWGATWDGVRKAWTFNGHDKLPELHRLVLATTTTTTLSPDPKTPPAAAAEHPTSTTQRVPEWSDP